MAHDQAGGLTGWDLEGFHNGGDRGVAPARRDTATLRRRA